MRIAQQTPDRKLVAVAQGDAASAPRVQPEPQPAEAHDPRPDRRCSVDPMAETDRYRLVTPYYLSCKDL